MKVAFLDRDGIVNQERGDYTWERNHFHFTSGLFEFLKKLKNEGYEIIIVTNQGGIEKGKYRVEDVDQLHHWMKDELLNNGISILDIFFCPHHSDFQKCLCRKPGSLLIEKAIARYNVDKDQSFMIGDRERDALAGKNAGIKGVVVQVNPDWSEFSLSDILN